MESKWNMMDLDKNMQSSHQFAQQTHPQFCPSTKPTDCVMVPNKVQKLGSNRQEIERQETGI